MTISALNPAAAKAIKLEKKRKAKIENAYARLYSAAVQNFVFPFQQEISAPEMEKIVLELVQENSFWPELTFNEALEKINIDFDSFSIKHNFYLETSHSDDEGGYDYEQSLKIEPHTIFAKQPLMAIFSFDTDIIYNEKKISLYLDWLKILVKNGANLNQMIANPNDTSLKSTLLANLVHNFFYVPNSSSYDVARAAHQNLIENVLRLGAKDNIVVCVNGQINADFFKGNLKEMLAWCTETVKSEGMDKLLFGSYGAHSSLHDFLPSCLEKLSLEKTIKVKGQGKLAPSSTFIKI